MPPPREDWWLSPVPAPSSWPPRDPGQCRIAGDDCYRYEQPHSQRAGAELLQRIPLGRFGDPEDIAHVVCFWLRLLPTISPAKPLSWMGHEHRMIRIFQGIDLVRVAKFQQVVTRHRAFLEEIFTSLERDYCLSRLAPHRHLAGRFAVKEACLKALGHGLSSNGIDRVLSEIEVVSGASGPPRLVLHAGRRHSAGKSTSFNAQFPFPIRAIMR